MVLQSLRHGVRGIFGVVPVGDLGLRWDPTPPVPRFHLLGGV
jgi:hypothetical protein